jgi:hypothetical protein
MLYLGLKALALFIFIVGSIAYVLPDDTVKDIYEFEQHHFFLFSFISLFLFILFFKLYSSLSQKDGKLNRKIIKIKKSIQDKRSMKYTHDLEIKLKHLDGEIIDKKEIPHLQFLSNDILSSHEEKLMRERELKKAMLLGNSYKHKVKIFFRDLKSFKKVETTVWFVDDKNVALKEGVILPIKAIYKIIV